MRGLHTSRFLHHLGGCDGKPQPSTKGWRTCSPGNNRSLISWLRCKLSFAAVRSSIMCIRGTRSSITKVSLLIIICTMLRKNVPWHLGRFSRAPHIVKLSHTLRLFARDHFSLCLWSRSSSDLRDPLDMRPEHSTRPSAKGLACHIGIKRFYILRARDGTASHESVQGNLGDILISCIVEYVYVYICLTTTFRCLTLSRHPRRSRCWR